MARDLISTHRKYCKWSTTPLHENVTSALNYALHNFCCTRSSGIILAAAQLHTSNYRTNSCAELHSLLSIQIHEASISNPAWLNLNQSIPDLSNTFSVQMSIKIHLPYWGIPVKHHITVKVSNHLNHADFSKNIQLCVSCQITSSRTVLSQWK